MLNNVIYRERSDDRCCSGLQAGGERNHTLIFPQTNGSAVASFDAKGDAAVKPKGLGTKDFFSVMFVFLI